MKTSLPESTEECIGLIDDILEYQACRAKYDTDKYLGEKLFGAQWQGQDSDWSVLRTLSNWVIELYKDIGSGELPQGLLNFLEGGTTLSSLDKYFNLLNSSIENLKPLIEDVCQRLKSSLSATETERVDDVELESLEVVLQEWLDQIDALYKMVRYNKLRKKIRARGLEQIDDLAYDWQHPPHLLLATLKKTWYEGLVNEGYQQNESIKHFDRISQENILSEFRRIDSQLFQHAQESLIVKHHSRLPLVNAAGEMATIRREIHKKRRHMPIRRLISQAGRAVQQIKPVFMMSPMSVATYLQQGAIDFDLVVFDEASQVKVVDAMGSILRGKQVVVVGDTYQMPPTDFFNKVVELDDEEAEESLTSDIESILDMFLVQGAQEAMLRWHYRSKHDSLITVSNQEFYDGRLMIFPSPGVNPHAKGLKFNHLPETVYERGGSKTNPLEARCVAEAAMSHAKNTPQFTLGIVAFSTAQRDCIILEIERMRREDPSCEGFFAKGSLESFFVKNLENVQGDERDVIFISIGYGRSSAGNLTTNFGPINRDGGERRLNVLITRARLSMEVFSNFTADDLETKSISPFGVRVLKNFLRYAQTGKLENRFETGKDTDSPFEDEVILAIQKLGYDVEPQVGSAGFYIDIAVKDPERQGRYILAVECDGASYHSSASARDRDRLRQKVLEGLGWRFHRIWSTDWFRNPHRETQRLKDSIDSAVSFYEELDSVGDPADLQPTHPPPVQNKTEIIRSPVTSPKGFDVDEYKLCSKCKNIPWRAEIHELPLDVVAAALREVIETEGAVHLRDGAKRIAESAGYARVGSRMLKHIEMAAMLGHRKDLLHFKHEFLYLDSNKEVKIRNRSSLSAACKKIEFVPDREIEEALKVTVRNAFSLPAEDAISEALSVMGFQRATQKARSRVNLVLSRLLKKNSLSKEGKFISCGGGKGY